MSGAGRRYRSVTADDRPGREPRPRRRCHHQNHDRPEGRDGSASMRSPITSLLLFVSLSTLTHERVADAGGVSEPGKTLKVVVFGGHPDDPESGAGGLIATLTRQGHEVICAYGTAFRGGRRFFDRPEAEVRREEATAACKVLGATPKFFPYAHETLVADEATLKAVSAWLDEVKPDVVVTHWPLDTHPNHHAVSSLVWQCYKRQGRLEPVLLRGHDRPADGRLRARSLPRHRGGAGGQEAVARCPQEPGPEDIWKAHEAMHRRRGAECGVDLPRRTRWSRRSRAARSCPSSSWRERAIALCPKRARSTAPPPSPRLSGIRMPSLSTPSDPSTRPRRR